MLVARTMKETASELARPTLNDGAARCCWNSLTDAMETRITTQRARLVVNLQRRLSAANEPWRDRKTTPLSYRNCGSTIIAADTRLRLVAVEQHEVVPERRIIGCPVRHRHDLSEHFTSFHSILRKKNLYSEQKSDYRNGNAMKAQKMPRKRKCILNRSANEKSIKPQLVTPRAQHRQCQLIHRIKTRSKY